MNNFNNNNSSSSSNQQSDNFQQQQQHQRLGNQGEVQAQTPTSATGELSSEFQRLLANTNNLLAQNINNLDPHEAQLIMQDFTRNLLSDRSTLNNYILNMPAQSPTTNNPVNGNGASRMAVLNFDESNQQDESNQALQQHYHIHQQDQQQPQQQQQQMQQAGNGAFVANQPPPGQMPENNIYTMALRALQSSIPFIFILLAKILHQHLIGFFIVIGFMTTLNYSNQTLIGQIALKDKKETFKLLLLILFLVTNITVFFLIFQDYKLENCLIFLSPIIVKLDTWNLIWIVVCTDTIIKFIIITVKSLVTLVPFQILPLRRRGNFYSIIETVGLFYRYLTPVRPWILYLLYSDLNLKSNFSPDNFTKQSLVDSAAANTTNNSSSTVFTIILCIVYLIFKINQTYNGLNDLTKSFRYLLTDNSYGVPVTITEFEDNVCPICQDKYSIPVMLKCKHKFCQDCVCMWLDKENSCPMCRAIVSVKKPVFRDGSTSLYVQWY